jgi:hypothetical protein
MGQSRESCTAYLLPLITNVKVDLLGSEGHGKAPHFVPTSRELPGF